MKTNARYVVFKCADNYGGEASKGGAQSTSLYYESVDLIDAFHPQTILATRMNGAPLSVGHGAPVRLRVERQLGYKQAKYVMGLDIVDSLAGYGRGKGGYWEDRGYEWYAGI
jgi:DMSO/TMAO reductase YedYZ molybdopterin-dependent catalytic subunit